jgi:hypothetical protein
MAEIFMTLGLLLDSSPEIIDPSDLNILVRLGARASLNNVGVPFGGLAALSPLLNGSVVALANGDHDVVYDLLTIMGRDINGNQFVISGFDVNGQGGTRTIIPSLV